ncbi:MAG: PIN domain-containing protein [Candidatus Omnitrophica bacterium]|nr:PIN domain-containing protein [Candidatus Omnitrophota bacterium]
MPEGEVLFLDTNVVLYALGTEEPKRTIAQDALGRAPVVSVQVLSEASNVLHRKYGIARSEVALQLETVARLVGRIVPLDEATLRRAWVLWDRRSMPWFYSLILAAAITAGCGILYSEDFQHGEVIDGRITIVNPFRSPMPEAR